MSNIHPLFQKILEGFAPHMEKTVSDRETVAAHDLQPGDELIETSMGGYAGRISSVHVMEPIRVRVIFEEPGQSAYLSYWEICVVKRAAARGAR